MPRWCSNLLFFHLQEKYEIQVRHGELPHEIATQFVSKQGLSVDYVEPLSTMLAQQIKLVTDNAKP